LQLDAKWSISLESIALRKSSQQEIFPVWFPPTSVMQVPHEMVTQSRNSYIDAEVHSPTLDELGKQVDEEGGNYQMYLESLMQNLHKEAKEKFKGWVTCSSMENTELAYKKVIRREVEEKVNNQK